VAKTEKEGEYSMRIAANGAGNPRTGDVRVGPPGNVDIFYQASPTAAALRVRQGQILTPTSATVPSVGGLIEVTVNYPPNTSWTSTTRETWLSVIAGATGTGQGAVTIRVAPHTGTEARTGEVLIGGQRFPITQQASACKYATTPETAAFPAAGGNGSVQILTACDWTASSEFSWITLANTSGRGDFTVRFTVAPNPNSQPRTGFLRVGGVTTTIQQEGSACNYTFSPPRVDFDAVGGSATFRVTGGSGCSWTASTGEDWIEIRTTSVAAGEVGYIVYPNPGPEPRTGRILLAGQAFTIVQAGRGPQISTAGLLNAASFQSGAIAPGEVVTFFGQGLGPEELVSATLNPQGLVSTSLAGVQVFFDDTPAPLVYVSARQLSAVVPYSVAEKQQVRIELDYQGVRSNAITVAVVPAAPALFTADASGVGQGAILNQDFSLNSPENPARPGDVIVLYGTGEGQTDPPGTDGKLAGADLPKPLLPVTARVGGRDAEVLYAGAAPGLLAGVLQMNVRIPEETPAGPAVVQIRIGNLESRAGVTVAVGP
jgi:uncharacterized protein (TIGR03437 family)